MVTVPGRRNRRGPVWERFGLRHELVISRPCQILPACLCRRRNRQTPRKENMVRADSAMQAHDRGRIFALSGPSFLYPKMAHSRVSDANLHSTAWLSHLDAFQIDELPIAGRRLKSARAPAPLESLGDAFASASKLMSGLAPQSLTLGRSRTVSLPADA